MANRAYSLGKQHLASGDWNWISSTIRGALVSSAYTPATATDELLSEIPSAALIATSDPLTQKTDNDGVLRAANITFLNLPASTAEFVVVYADLGSPFTSLLIALIDTAPGLPLASVAGAAATILWDTGVDGILAI